MLTCWLTGEILVKARFRQEVAGAFIARIQTMGWVSLRAAGVLPLVLALNLHMQCDKLQSDLQRARAQRGIVEQVDHRMTAAQSTERPTLVWVEKGTGNRIAWTQKDNVIQWLQQQ